MKYVFFDIECACVFKNTAKICAFGYVVTDEKFNVLEKEDILIDPRGKFHLTDRKGGEGLVLPYEYEDFKKHPAFPAEYARIKALLEDKEATSTISTWKRAATAFPPSASTFTIRSSFT